MHREAGDTPSLFSAQLRRIPLLGNRVNKGKKKGRDPYNRTPASLYPTPSLWQRGTYNWHYKRVLLRVDHTAGGREGRFLGQRRIQLALACSLEVVAAVVVEVHPVLDDDLLAEVVRHIGGHREGPLVFDGALSIGHREAIDCQGALGAGVALGGQRDLDGSVGGQSLCGGDEVVASRGGQGRALTQCFFEAV